MRKHLNIHQSYEDPCQRFLNSIGVESYIRPHRHSLDPKTETLVAVRGMFALVVFDERGNVTYNTRFGTEKHAADGNIPVVVELKPETWHTVLALSEGAVLLELKAGPFDPNAAKEFAEWAPDEGTAQAAEYLRALRKHVMARSATDLFTVAVEQPQMSFR